MLTILHTADLHLGHVSGQLEPEAARKLARARLTVVETILGLADQYDVRAVLCAGDLFDTPSPDPDWWRGLLASFTKRTAWSRPVLLLPGNHDPLIRDSVYDRAHPFRRGLPPWVHVVDRDNFELALGADAVVYSSPCRSTAGADDLALALPRRADGDERIRIGLVHGSTFDLPDYQTNFPISREAPGRCGLDYLAVGDTHSFREIPEGAVAPIVYPSAPEPTNFKESDTGQVAIVTFRRRGLPPRIRKERVARWTWRDENVDTLAGLRKLASEDLTTTVLRVHVDMTVSMSEKEEVDALLESLRGTLAAHGRAGALVADCKNLREVSVEALDLDGAPETIREVAQALQARAVSCDKARRALVILHRLLKQVR